MRCSRSILAASCMAMFFACGGKIADDSREVPGQPFNTAPGGENGDSRDGGGQEETPFADAATGDARVSCTEDASCGKGRICRHAVCIDDVVCSAGECASDAYCENGSCVPYDLPGGKGSDATCRAPGDAGAAADLTAQTSVPTEICVEQTGHVDLHVTACNRGAIAAPAGVVARLVHRKESQQGAFDPATARHACTTAATTQPLAPGACVDLSCRVECKEVCAGFVPENQNVHAFVSGSAGTLDCRASNADADSAYVRCATIR